MANKYKENLQILLQAILGKTFLVTEIEITQGIG